MEGVKSGKKDNSKRRYPGIGGRGHNSLNKELRRKSKEDPTKSEEVVRQEAWAKLGPKGQLAALDARLGKDVRAVAQRARLQNLIDNPPKPVKKVATPTVEETLETGSGGRLKAKDRKATERSKRPGASGRGA